MLQLGNNKLGVSGMKLDDLIDTNIFISLFNQELTQPIPNGKIGYSVITAIDILSFKGLSLQEENLIHSTLKNLTEVSLDATIAEKKNDSITAKI
jgi:predicted nucleic acid-binding protein